jgi:sigma-B regulation protein RsbU (phosphoserine phosphatase)
MEDKEYIVHRDMNDTEAAIVMTMASDIFELVNAQWLIAVKNTEGHMSPLLVLGEPNSLDETLERVERTMLLSTGASELYSIESPERTRSGSVLTCPLIEHATGIAALIIGPRRDGQGYSGEDREIMTLVSSQMGNLLKNPSLSARVGAAVLNMRRTRTQLEAARNVQQGMLPGCAAHIRNLHYYGECRPAYDVAGDFFDFIPLAGGHLGVAIGDVAGRGIPAALLTSGLQMSLRILMHDNWEPLSDQIARLNNLMCEVLPEEAYATMFYATIDRNTFRATYVNAGHVPPLLIHGKTGNVQWLGQGGTALGLFANSTYEIDTVFLDEGDVLVGFTDGISEARKFNGSEMTVSGIARAVAKYSDHGVRKIVESIMEEAVNFSGRAIPEDDRTALALRVYEPIRCLDGRSPDAAEDELSLACSNGWFRCDDRTEGNRTAKL